MTQTAFSESVFSFFHEAPMCLCPRSLIDNQRRSKRVEEVPEKVSLVPVHTSKNTHRWTSASLRVCLHSGIF